ncbi:hypothetical protein A1O3_05767 [Capronia epimyces CBS 606.96]|uniref:Succinate dehydrogenase [ubiquinone] cytochrome b small subunit n=1 Tax=Capronia epimyces CBS 606.96 TaxID=1182542 RepID=W9XWZ6_9EURO|nr:uncharacterized protein A1O3_05767 [Capronia epimyces CBS 606.96]EXJ85092.1 hypothetical protein A1O3_05767 [Capronia epimyces CBS 606.96]
MAAASRASLLRQTQFLASSPTRLFSSTTQPLRLLRTTPSISSRLLLAPKWSAVSRAAPFSTTSQRNLLPPGPQVIEGTVNDPAAVPKVDPLHGSYHWTFERLLSVGLIPLTIAPFAAGSVNPALDAALIFSLIVHSHMGFQSMITDYIPRHKFPTMRKAFSWLLNVATVVVAIGFYEFETNDVGVTEAIKRIWHAGENDATIGKTDLSSLGHDGKLKNLK